MTPADRAAAYFRQKAGAMTPKQQRRYRSKVLRGLSSSVATGVATDGAPYPQVPAHAPTVVVTNPATVGASLGGVCSRCGHPTTRGHYWALCSVSKSVLVHHFCCPGDCELTADLMAFSAEKRAAASPGEVTG